MDEAIIDAVLDMLAEGSTIESLSIEAIAARAGVGKATIYRRWPGKEALLRDALRTIKPFPAPPAGRGVREDLINLLSPLERNRDPRVMKIMPCLVPEVHRSPDQRRLYEELIEPRRAAIRDVLRRGMDSGQLRADIDVEVCLAMMSGSMLLRRLLMWGPDTDERELAERIVDNLLNGMLLDSPAPGDPTGK
ncbi:TetR/AcrR family transcriptional regulator [Plantactinospora sp. KBS50]|uniref:TetR/AcrR family transcriptional regulator n=1 Tax=Plantactinospora sp. KBS50 TaxID=2024580 RepID=UPI00268BF7F9